MTEKLDGRLMLFDVDEVVQPHLIPMEANLDGWPLFSRQKRRKKGDTMEVSQKVATDGGHRVEQLWKASVTSEFTLPGPFDEDVFVGVMALVKKRGGMPVDGKLRFSVYELIQAMGKTKRGRINADIRESLDRIASTVYVSKNAFYVAETQSLESDRFTLWSVHYSKASSKDGRGAEHHTLRFDDIIIRSYTSGYLRLLDTDLYLRLNRPLAKGLYRLVNVRRAEGREWSVPVLQLRDLLGMSRRYSSVSKVWEKLEPALADLTKEGFLERAYRAGDRARFVTHPEYAADWPSLDGATINDGTADGDDGAPRTLAQEAVQALKDAGMWPRRARQLVGRCGPEKAFHVLTVFRLEGSRAVKKSAGAYLAGMLEDGDPAELKEHAEWLETRQAQGSAQPPLPTAGADGRDRERGDRSYGEDGQESKGDGGVAHEGPGYKPDADAEEVWEAVLREIEGDIDESTKRVWFAGIFACGLEGDALSVVVPNDFAKEYVEDRFGPQLQRALRERLGPGATVRVIIGRKA